MQVKLNTYHWGIQWNSVLCWLRRRYFGEWGNGGKGRNENRWDVSGAGQSEKFSASTIDGNITGKIFFISWYICHKLVCFLQLSKAGLLSVSLKIDKIKYRAVIKFFVKEGLTPN
jgi:hypothetical protein